MNTDAPTDDPVNDPVPRYTASGGPVTPMMRVAFRVWVILFLFILVFTLIIYLVDKIHGGP